MEYILKKAELQALRDEAQNAKEEFERVSKHDTECHNRLLDAMALCQTEISGAEKVDDADQYWQGRKAVAEGVLAIIMEPLKEGDS